MAAPSPSRELTSWKEIAAYLQVSVRTAQLWERDRGLPIRRIPGPRGQVRASIDELDAWKSSAAPLPVADESGADWQPEPESTPAPAPKGRRSWIAGAVLVSAAITVAFAIFARPKPVALSLQSDGIAALDASGKILWRFVTAPLNAGVYLGYETRYWLGQLDSDDHPDTLFVPQPAGLTTTHVPLLRIDHNGKEVWRFNAGAPSPDPFMVRQFTVLPNRNILLTAHHHMYSPAYIALLNPDGKPLWEYRHKGHLNSMAVTSSHIAYFGGVDQVERLASVVALDTRSGAELHRVLLPRSCLFPNEEYNVVENLVWNGAQLLVDAHEGYTVPRPASIQFVFTPQLQLTRLTLSDVFFIYHRARVPAHDFFATEYASLQKIIRRK